MATKVGINGFGRIGRMVFRAAADRNDIEIVGINDLLEVEYLAYMLKYDSVHGRFDGSVEVENGELVVNGSKIRITAEMDPANLAWDEVGAEVVVESTGFFLTDETARKHIEAGAKKLFYPHHQKTIHQCLCVVLIQIHMQAKTLYQMLHVPQTV